MDVNRTRRGTTIRLTDAETTELLTALAMSVAAYGILQNFMTVAQKGMTLPSIVFVSRLGAAIWDATGGVTADTGDPGPSTEA